MESTIDCIIDFMKAFLVGSYSFTIHSATINFYGEKKLLRKESLFLCISRHVWRSLGHSYFRITKRLNTKRRQDSFVIIPINSVNLHEYCSKLSFITSFHYSQNVKFSIFNAPCPNFALSLLSCRYSSHLFQALSLL